MAEYVQLCPVGTAAQQTRQHFTTHVFSTAAAISASHQDIHSAHLTAGSAQSNHPYSALTARSAHATVHSPFRNAADRRSSAHPKIRTNLINRAFRATTCSRSAGV